MSLGTVVDSNVLLDVFTEDERWAEWSGTQLAHAFDTGPVVINPLIYADLSIGFSRTEELDDALPSRVPGEDLPWEAAFLAGRCFLEYRQRGGARRSPAPDRDMAAFHVTAHAAVTGRALLTRDRPRYATLLPPSASSHRTARDRPIRDLPSGGRGAHGAQRRGLPWRGRSAAADRRPTC